MSTLATAAYISARDFLSRGAPRAGEKMGPLLIFPRFPTALVLAMSMADPTCHHISNPCPPPLAATGSTVGLGAPRPLVLPAQAKLAWSSLLLARLPAPMPPRPRAPPVVRPYRTCVGVPLHAAAA